MVNTVFLFCGSAGSGKDTSFHFFKELLEKNSPKKQIKNYAFGLALKEIVSDLSQLYLGETYPVQEMENLAYKERERPEHKIFLEGIEKPLVIRTLLQQVGTNILRKHLGEDIFAECVVKQIAFQFMEEDQIAVVTDLRFPNEFLCVRGFCDAMGYRCYTIYIQRNGKLDSHNHISESFYNELKKDFIINNNGTLEELKIQLEIILSRVKN